MVFAITACDPKKPEPANTTEPTVDTTVETVVVTNTDVVTEDVVVTTEITEPVTDNGTDTGVESEEDIIADSDTATSDEVDERGF